MIPCPVAYNIVFKIMNIVMAKSCVAEAAENSCFHLESSWMKVIPCNLEMKYDLLSCHCNVVDEVLRGRSLFEAFGKKDEQIISRQEIQLFSILSRKQGC